MIKIANKNDSKTLAQMAVNIWDNDSISDLAAEFDDMTENPKCISFIKYIEDKPVGFANASLRYDYVEGCDTSPVGYLEGIYVLDNYRSKNIARDLVRACEHWARDKACVEFASDCQMSNLDSLSFHKAVGFEETNRIICFNKKL